MKKYTRNSTEKKLLFCISFCLNFFPLLSQKPNLEKFSINSNKFFHNFQMSEASFTCPGLRASGLAQRLLHECEQIYFYLKEKKTFAHLHTCTHF